MKELYADLETFSTIDLKSGTHAYAEEVEIMLFPYAIDEDEPKCWDVTSGEPIPEDLKDALEDPEVVTVWHNGGMFDLTVLNHDGANHGIPPLSHDRVFDTMVCAFAHSLPGKLSTLCDVLKVSDKHAKHKSGMKLIQLFCKPRPVNSALRRATRETHPKEWAEFIEYAKADITSMREVKRKLPIWNYRGFEYQLWLLDQKINQRGVAVDLELAEGAVLSSEKAKKLLAKKAHKLTDGAVPKATQRELLLTHIMEGYGIPLPDMKKATLERRINDPDVPEELKELLKVRLQASTTSVSKYKTLLKATSPDGRLRGLLQFDGAGRTRRWSGRTFQPQNLMRPDMDHDDILEGIEVIKANACELFYEDQMRVISNAVRGCLIAPPGRKFVVADLSNIEGRVAAWLAGEEWKLDAFRDFDAGRGPDLYSLAYAKSFHVSPEEVTLNKKQGDGSMRQIGKVQELMLQYEGGVGAFLTGAATYGIDLADMADKSYGTLPPEVLKSAESFLEWTIKQKRSTFGLDEKVFVTCDSLKRMWREAQPMISSYWKELKEAYVDAVNNPGRKFKARKLVFYRSGAWLRVQLPSGSCLCYPSPRVDDGVCSYMGMNQYTRKWERIKTYGGKLFENITQGLARDVMAYSMPVAEDRGYEIVLTVHDELITETPDDSEYSVDILSDIMATNPPWAEGMPLAAAGFEATRYRKE